MNRDTAPDGPHDRDPADAALTAALARALSCLLPGQPPFPPAGALGLEAGILAEPRFAGAARAVLDAAPDLEQLSDAAAETRLRQIETAQPALFGAFVVAAYSAYYTHPAVLAAIEAQTGYRAGPPQPGGYQLDPFDVEMLAVPAARAAGWRDPREEGA
ncbi:MAG: hypothetical protein AAFR46_04965 [Pseudomonadota bacterium]